MLLRWRDRGRTWKVGAFFVLGRCGWQNESVNGGLLLVQHIELLPDHPTLHPRTEGWKKFKALRISIDDSVRRVPFGFVVLARSSVTVNHRQAAGAGPQHVTNPNGNTAQSGASTKFNFSYYWNKSLQYVGYNYKIYPIYGK